MGRSWSAPETTVGLPRCRLATSGYFSHSAVARANAASGTKQQVVAMSSSLADLSASDFEQRNGEVFRLLANGQELELRLAEVTRLGGGRREGGAFSLLFMSPPGPLLPQAIYPIAHPAMGTLDLFIVPLGPKDGGNSYEAVFT
jgi:hypothetical protein